MNNKLNFRTRTPLHTKALRAGSAASPPAEEMPAEERCSLHDLAERPLELKTATIPKREVVERFLRSGLARVIDGKAYLTIRGTTRRA